MRGTGATFCELCTWHGSEPTSGRVSGTYGMRHIKLALSPVPHTGATDEAHVQCSVQ